ncbi:MAG: hypothetical protein IT361_00060 [Gemmatimonadaceae bacterium]|nr:hypothetical protein [Gemmatimonadaceae bacterium]
MTSLQRAATELHTLAERFIALSEAGLQACVESNDGALATALDARDLVSARFATVAGHVSALRRVMPRGQRADADAILAPVERVVRHAATLNGALLQRAADLRGDIGRQLDLLRRDAEAGKAYHARPAEARHALGLDETR